MFDDAKLERGDSRTYVRYNSEGELYRIVGKIIDADDEEIFIERKSKHDGIWYQVKKLGEKPNVIKTNQ